MSRNLMRSMNDGFRTFDKRLCETPLGKDISKKKRPKRMLSGTRNHRETIATNTYS